MSTGLESHQGVVAGRCRCSKKLVPLPNISNFFYDRASGYAVGHIVHDDTIKVIERRAPSDQTAMMRCSKTWRRMGWRWSARVQVLGRRQ
jgi:hypothetical protein